MRTRRSPRNQMILWRALGGGQVSLPKRSKGRLPSKADVIAARAAEEARLNLTNASEVSP